jgi:hypothetical protein
MPINDGLAFENEARENVAAALTLVIDLEPRGTDLFRGGVREPGPCRMAGGVIVDLRHVLDPLAVRQLGMRYTGVGQ